VGATAELSRVEVGGATTLGTSEETAVLSTAVDVAAVEVGTVEVGGTMTSGSRPVEPRTGSRIGLSVFVEEAGLLCTVDVGCTITSGTSLVVPISFAGGAEDAAADEETMVVGSGSGMTSGEGRGWTIDSGRPVVEPT
jgi:hypothetical protein